MACPLNTRKNDQSRHRWLRSNRRSTSSTSSTSSTCSGGGGSTSTSTSTSNTSKTSRGCQRLNHLRYEREWQRESARTRTKPIIVRNYNAQADAPPSYYVTNVRYVSYGKRWWINCMTPTAYFSIRSSLLRRQCCTDEVLRFFSILHVVTMLTRFALRRYNASWWRICRVLHKRILQKKTIHDKVQQSIPHFNTAHSPALWRMLRCHQNSGYFVLSDEEYHCVTELWRRARCSYLWCQLINRTVVHNNARVTTLFASLFIWTRIMNCWKMTAKKESTAEWWLVPAPQQFSICMFSALGTP